MVMSFTAGPSHFYPSTVANEGPRKWLDTSSGGLHAPIDHVKVVPIMYYIHVILQNQLASI